VLFGAPRKAGIPTGARAARVRQVLQNPKVGFGASVRDPRAGRPPCRPFGSAGRPRSAQLEHLDGGTAARPSAFLSAQQGTSASNLPAETRSPLATFEVARAIASRPRLGGGRRGASLTHRWDVWARGRGRGGAVGKRRAGHCAAWPMAAGGAGAIAQIIPNRPASVNRRPGPPATRRPRPVSAGAAPPARRSSRPRIVGTAPSPR
jgi:hypothetical protein